MKKTMSDRNIRPMGRKVFLAFLGDDDKKIEGFFELLEQTPQYLKFKTPTAVITISYNRLLKLKEVSDAS